MAVAQGRAEIVPDTTSSTNGKLYVELKEAPAHSFNQAYLQQVWRHHAWRHGAGALAGMAAAAEVGGPTQPPMKFHFEPREPTGPDPRVAGDESAVKSMYRRRPRRQRPPPPDTEAAECTQGFKNEPADGLSHYWRMYRSEDPADQAAITRLNHGSTVTKSTCSALYHGAASTALRASQSAALAGGGAVPPHDVWDEMGCSESHFEQRDSHRKLHVAGEGEEAGEQAAAFDEAVGEAEEDDAQAESGDEGQGGRRVRHRRG